MFRRVLITFTAVLLLFSLYSVAQDAAAPAAPNAQSQDSTSAPAQNGSNADAQPSSAQAAEKKPADTTADSTALPPATKHSSTKKHKKSKEPINPIANLDSKQPDKVLFDRAQDALKHGKYDVARLSLQTLINTYPDSEYVARAKLAIGDSWYAEGGTVALSQAENEYKDFITFFPNMPEAAEAQMKIANIHFREMEKADRDPTHARRAEDEYRQLILNFPDSKLVPEAKERLLEVQEVLARREYLIGHFYYLRESYPAAIARLRSVADTYPLYSAVDEALFELGGAYEGEVENVRLTKLPEARKGALLKEYSDHAIEAYSRIITKYPLESRAADAKKRLEALKAPIPTPSPEAIAADKAQIASRGTLGTMGKVMENFRRGPDVSEATHVGEPTLVDPKQASAPDLIREADVILATGKPKHELSVERTDAGTPAENAPVPRSDATPGTSAPATDATTPAAPANDAAPAGSDLKNDLPPQQTAAPPLPPTQVNDVAGTSASSSSDASDSAQKAAPANPDTESSSKKKKKKHLGIF
jgi:outer membrane protein assembly factor BamD